MKVETLKQSLLDAIASNQVALLLLEHFRADDDLPNVSVQIGSNMIDFDSATKEQKYMIMQRLGLGEWEKEPSVSAAFFDYTSKSEFMGHKVRLWAAPAPESCRIVEYIEVIPAQPEQTVVRRKVICAKDGEI